MHSSTMTRSTRTITNETTCDESTAVHRVVQSPMRRHSSDTETTKLMRIHARRQAACGAGQAHRRLQPSCPVRRQVWWPLCIRRNAPECTQRANTHEAACACSSASCAKLPCAMRCPTALAMPTGCGSARLGSRARLSRCPVHSTPVLTSSCSGGSQSVVCSGLR
jgi:hypothetical protein